MQSALDVQSTCLDMSRSTTAGQLPHTELELVVLKPQSLLHNSRHIFKQQRQNSFRKITVLLISPPVRYQIEDNRLETDVTVVNTANTLTRKT
jgi:hypothetical protein